MKLRKILALSLAAMLVLGLTACGGSGQEVIGSKPSTENTVEENKAETTADQPKEAVEIKFYEHADNEKLAQELVDAYNAQSDNVKVTLSIIANDDYDDKMKVLLSGGSGVDCFWVRGGSEMRQMASSGALYDMEDMIQADGIKTNVYGDISEAFMLSDKTYGMCFTKSCWLLFYNKDLFDQAQIDYPIHLTWDQYSDLAASLTTDELFGGVVPTWTMNLGASSVGEYLTDENLTKTKDYAGHMERWYVTDHSHPSVEEMSGSFALSSFYAQGTTYMMLNGDWALQTFPGYEPDFTWCVAPLPIYEGAEEGSTVGTASCLSIAANSAHPEEAFDFIKFCTYSEEGAIILAGNSAVSAYPSEQAVATYKENVTTLGVEYVFSSKVGMEKGLHDNYDELNEAYNEEIISSLVGNCTLEKAFELFKTRREEILNK